MSAFNCTKYRETMPRVYPEWTGDKLTRLKTVCYMSFRLAKD